MPIVKCKACGVLVNHPAEVRAARCTNCGTSVDMGSALKSGASETIDPAAEDSWLRDLLVRIYCRTLIVLMLYVLSTGPMYWAVYEAYRASGSIFLAKLYYPIVLACESSEFISNWFDWYVGLWVY